MGKIATLSHEKSCIEQVMILLCSAFSSIQYLLILDKNLVFSVNSTV